MTFCVAQRIGGTADPTVAANLMHCFEILGQDEGMIRLELAVMDAAHVRFEFDKKKLADLVELLGKFPQALPRRDLPRIEPHGAVHALARQP